MSTGPSVIGNEGKQRCRSYVMVTVLWCGVDTAYINVGRGYGGRLIMHRKVVEISGCNRLWK
jgi:hypothetical protein